MKNYFYILFIIFAFSQLFGSQQIEVGIDEKLGNNIPMDLQFVNSKGDTVQLKDVITIQTQKNFV